MRILFSAALTAMFTGILSAQSYQTALGVRFGQGANITLQQYIHNGWTAEGIVHTSLFSPDLGVTVLGEKHQKLFVRNLNFYYGGGLHYFTTSDRNRDEDLTAKNVFGVSGILGAELSLGRVNLAVDFKPEVHLTGDTSRPIEWHPAAVSLRYIIEKRERKRLIKKDAFDRFKFKRRS